MRKGVQKLAKTFLGNKVDLRRPEEIFPYVRLRVLAERRVCLLVLPPKTLRTHGKTRDMLFCEILTMYRCHLEVDSLESIRPACRNLQLAVLCAPCEEVERYHVDSLVPDITGKDVAIAHA